MCYLVWENKKIRNFEKEHVAVLTCMSGTSPGNMRSKHTSLIYFPTCTGDLIYIPFHWCVCDAFGVPQPDDWPGIGPQPFVVSSSDFFFFLFIILFLSGTRHLKSIPMPGRFQTLKWQKIVQTSNTSKPKFHGLKSEAVLGDFGELSRPHRWVKKQTVVWSRMSRMRYNAKFDKG